MKRLILKIGDSTKKLEQMRGSVLIEAALSIPIMLFLFSAIIDIGQMIRIRTLFNEAAYEAAKFAAQDIYITAGSCAHTTSGGIFQGQVMTQYTVSCPFGLFHDGTFLTAWILINEQCNNNATINSFRFNLVTGTRFETSYIPSTSLTEPDTVKVSIEATYSPIFPIFANQKIRGTASRAYLY